MPAFLSTFYVDGLKNVYKYNGNDLSPSCSIPKNTCSCGISIRLIGDTAFWSSKELQLIKLIANRMPFGKEQNLSIQSIPRETLIYKW